jgi:hypothetical protein
MAYVYGVSGLGLAWSDVQAGAQRLAQQVQTGVQAATGSGPKGPSADEAALASDLGQRMLAENQTMRAQLGLSPGSFKTLGDLEKDNASLRAVIARSQGSQVPNIPNLPLPGGSEFPVLPALGLGLVALFLLKGK